MGNTTFSRIIKEADRKASSNAALLSGYIKSLEKYKNELEDAKAATSREDLSAQDFVAARNHEREIEDYIEYYQRKIDDYKVARPIDEAPRDVFDEIKREQDKLAQKYCDVVLKGIAALEAEAGRILEDIKQGDVALSKWLSANNFMQEETDNFVKAIYNGDAAAAESALGNSSVNNMFYADNDYFLIYGLMNDIKTSIKRRTYNERKGLK